ncbi:MAG: hypothetical protein EZS28_030339, partial [Streblomastix strix]
YCLGTTRYSMISTNAYLIDCDPDCTVIIKRCVLCNDQKANPGDKFNTGIFSGYQTQGGFFNCIFLNSHITSGPLIWIKCALDFFDQDLHESANNECKFQFDADYIPKNNPIQMLFEFYNVTFRNVSTVDSTTPLINISSTPSICIKFEFCLFEETTGILIQLNRSHFNTEEDEIKQIKFNHCTWIQNGKIMNSTDIQEAGALTVQYTYYQNYTPDQFSDQKCMIKIGNVIVENCIFSDNEGSKANDILIDEGLLDEQLITFYNCFIGKQGSSLTAPNFSTFIYDQNLVDIIPTQLSSLKGISEYTSSQNRNKIINSSSTLAKGELTQFVSMMIKYDPGYNIQFQKGITAEETTLNVKYNKLSIFKDDSVQEEVIFLAKETPIYSYYAPFQQYSAYIDPYSSPLITVEQSGEIFMKSIVILHFYEKSLNPVIQVKDEAKFNGIQLIFRPIVEQLVGMATLPTTEQTSPYLLCLGGFTILEQCQFLPTNFENSAAIRTMHEIGINSKEGAQQDDYNLTLKECQLIGMNRIDEAENSGSAIDAFGMKITLEDCIFDMNTQQSNMMKNKINIQDLQMNEEEQTQSEEHLIPTCGWNTAYIKQNTGSLILSKRTQLTNLNRGAISLLGSTLTITDADVQFLNNIDNSLLKSFHNNENEDQPVIMKRTLLRRNIACGYGSRITSPIESFSENGLQEDSLWILKTDKGKKIEDDQQDNVYEIECQLAGGLQNVKSPLFIPHIDEASGIIRKDKLGLDITIIGRHFVRCGAVKYKVCEKIKITNDDGQEIIEKIKERELHCQTDLMENAIQWDNETQFTILTQYKTIRKWKSMEIWLIFADGSQISEILSLSIGKLSTSAIIIIVVISVVAIIVVVAILIALLIYGYKQKNKIYAMRQLEEQIDNQSNNTHLYELNRQQNLHFMQSSQYE